MRFTDGSHCHWTWRQGAYQTFGFWPTRELAQQAADGACLTISDIRKYEQPEVFQVHSPSGCTCTDVDMKETA